MEKHKEFAIANASRISMRATLNEMLSLYVARHAASRNAGSMSARNSFNFFGVNGLNVILQLVKDPSRISSGIPEEGISSRFIKNRLF